MHAAFVLANADAAPRDVERRRDRARYDEPGALFLRLHAVQPANGRLRRLDAFERRLVHASRAADQPSPGSLFINNGVVYWLDSGTYTNDNITGNGGVRSAPLGTNQTFNDLVNDKTAIDYTGLALSGSTLYYGIGSGNAIHTVATIGGSFSTYTSSTTGSITVLIADATNIYWADSSKIQKCGLGSCSQPQTFATAQTPSVMAQDTASLFWANGGGEIRRLAK